ncbi:MAG TPA: CHASE3 domain-containing protein [Usitatibacter sp.]|nr:CHASE3 domain-containing protein [Usitatibacter sp.]
MISSSNLRRSLSVAGVVLLAYFVLDATLNVRNVAKLQDQAEVVLHTHEVAAAIVKVLSDLTDAETGQRGFIITGDEQYLDPYTQAVGRLDSDLAALGSLVNDPEQEEGLAQLRSHVETKLSELRTTIQLRREAGFDVARAAVHMNIGKQHMDAMRAVGASMMRRELDRLAARQEAANAAAFRTTAQIVLSDAIGGLVIIAFLLLLRRHLGTRDQALAEIASQREQLQVADRLKDEFLATLAHELRNPLAPMSNSLFILSRREAPQHARERALSTLQRQVRQMVKLIDDLLDVGRIRLGKLSLTPRALKLADVVEHAVETVAPLIEASRHRLEVALPSAPVFLQADPIRLGQVISNLLNNAAKFTPAGGEISLSASVEPGWVSLRVKDNGAGIDPQRLNDVFGLFTQLDQSIERQHSGLGIGLALVRRLTELHGGTVEARSDGAGKGSEFIVRLPTIEAPALPSIALPERDDAALRPRRVLVVDDNPDGSDTLAAMVKLMGHESRVSHDGPSALSAGGEWNPDLVIMDIGMPGMNGYEACTAMRATPWGRNALIVALTGWGQDHDRRRAEAAGFDRHVVKPIGAELLRELCEDARLPASASP